MDSISIRSDHLDQKKQLVRTVKDYLISKTKQDRIDSRFIKISLKPEDEYCTDFLSYSQRLFERCVKILDSVGHTRTPFSKKILLYCIEALEAFNWDDAKINQADRLSLIATYICGALNASKSGNKSLIVENIKTLHPSLSLLMDDAIASCHGIQSIKRTYSRYVLWAGCNRYIITPKVELYFKKITLKARSCTVMILDNFEKGFYSHGMYVLKAAQWRAPYVSYVRKSINTEFQDASKKYKIIQAVEQPIYTLLISKTAPSSNCRIINRSSRIDPADNKNFLSHYIVMYSMLESFTKTGAIVVLSAGNEGKLLKPNFLSRNIEVYNNINKDKTNPGAVLMVGVYDPEAYQMASYSNLAGLAKDFYIYDTVDDKKMSGTSLTAPKVSAYLARLHILFPQYTSKQVVKLLLITGEAPKVISNAILDRIKDNRHLTIEEANILNPDDIYGRGRINMNKAVHLGLTQDIDKIILRPLNHENDKMLQKRALS